MASTEQCENTTTADSGAAVATVEPPSVEDRQALIERERNTPACTAQEALPTVDLFEGAQTDGRVGADDDTPGPGDDEEVRSKSKTGDDIGGTKKNTLASFEQNYGVQAETTRDADGNSVYKFYVEGENGKRVEIASANDLSDVDEKLTEWRDNKVRELEKKFNINISADGDISGPVGDKLRAPKADELVALESALFHSQPSQLTHGPEPLQVNFHADDSKNHASYYPGHRTIEVFREKNDKETFDDRFYTFQHELAHNGQDNIDFNKHADALGWKQTEAGEWITKGKDGQYWKRDFRDQYAESNLWVRVDANGTPIEYNGKPTHLSNEKMRDNMQVRPDSLYFVDPWEMMAEGSTHFRDGRGARQDLYRNDPKLYDQIKAADQEEITRAYGTAPDGTPNYIRNPDGMIVHNTPEQRKILAEYERGLAQFKEAATGGGSKEGAEHGSRPRSKKYEEQQPPSVITRRGGARLQ